MPAFQILMRRGGLSMRAEDALVPCVNLLHGMAAVGAIAPVYLIEVELAILTVIAAVRMSEPLVAVAQGEMIVILLLAPTILAVVILGTRTDVTAAKPAARE